MATLSSPRKSGQSPVSDYPSSATCRAGEALLPRPPQRPACSGTMPGRPGIVAGRRRWSRSMTHSGGSSLTGRQSGRRVAPAWAARAGRRRASRPAAYHGPRTGCGSLPRPFAAAQLAAQGGTSAGVGRAGPGSRGPRRAGPRCGLCRRIDKRLVVMTAIHPLQRAIVDALQSLLDATHFRAASSASSSSTRREQAIGAGADDQPDNRPGVRGASDTTSAAGPAGHRCSCRAENRPRNGSAACGARSPRDALVDLRGDRPFSPSRAEAGRVAEYAAAAADRSIEVRATEPGVHAHLPHPAAEPPGEKIGQPMPPADRWIACRTDR